MLRLAKGIVTTLALGISTAAFSYPVNLDSVSGIWGTPTNGSNVQGVGTDTLRWGTGEETCSGHLWWHTCSNGPQSGFSFQGPASLPQTITSDDAFVLGDFTHFNNRITGDSITSVNLDVFATFSTNASNGTVTGPYTFEFSHIETPNISCGPLSFIFGCSQKDVDDVVRLDNIIESSEFQFGSSIYSLSLLGFATGADSIETAEGEATSVSLLAKLNVRLGTGTRHPRTAGPGASWSGTGTPPQGLTPSVRWQYSVLLAILLLLP